MKFDTNGYFVCSILVKIKLFEFKFRINDSIWSTSSDFKTKMDNFGNKNNVISIVSLRFVHHNLVELRKDFSSFKRKLGSFYPKTHIEQIAEDVCVIKRFPKSFETSYVLIVRMNYNKNAEPIDIDYELPGWLHETKKAYCFEKDYEFMDGDVPRIKCNVYETNSLFEFGYVSHR